MADNNAHIVVTAEDRATQTLRSIGRATQDLAAPVNTLRSAFGGLAAVLSVGTLAQFGVSVVKAASEAEQASARLDAILKATGNSAGIARKEIDGLADAMARSTQFDDEAIRKAGAELLKFGNIQGNVFREALKLSADVAAFDGGDIADAARNIGKALLDVEGAQKLLKNAGVKLTEQQKDQVKAFIDAGDAAGAQRLVLDALKNTYDGMATSLNTGLTKATGDLGKSWDELLESLGKTGPVSLTTKSTLSGITGILDNLTKAIEESGAAAQNNILFKAGALPLSERLLPGEKERTSKPFIVPAADAAQAAKMRLVPRETDEAEYARRKKAAEDATKAAKDAAKARESAYASLTKSIAESIAVEQSAAQATEKLTAGQQMAAKFVADLASGQLKLTDEQKRSVATSLDQLITLQKTNAAREETVKWLAQEADAYADLDKSIADAQSQTDGWIKGMQDGNAQREFELGIMGRTEVEQQVLLEQRRIDLELRDKLNALEKEGIGLGDERIAQLKQAANLEKQSAANYIRTKDRFSKEQEAWKDFSRDIERSLTDALMRSFESGSSFGKTFVETLNNTLKSTVLKVGVQAIVSPATSGIQSLLGGGGGSGSGAGNWFNNLGSSAAAAAPSSWGFTAPYVDSGAEFAGEIPGLRDFTSAGQQFASATNTLGSVISYASAAYAASEGDWGQAIGTAAGQYFGGPIGAAIGSEIGKAVDEAFGGGGGAKLGTVQQFGLQDGQINKLGSWADMSGGDPLGVAALAAGTLQQLSGVASKLGAKIDSTKLTLGYELDPQGTAVGKVHYGIGSQVTTTEIDGRDQAGAAAALQTAAARTVLLGLQDLDLTPWAQKIADSIDAVSATSTEITAALQRLDGMATLVPIMDAIGISADSLSQSLVDALGGYGQASQSVATYYDNYFTAAEKTARLTEALGQRFADLGLEMPDLSAGADAARAQFRGLVESLDLSTTAGEEMFAALIQMSPAFAQLAGTIVSATETIDSASTEIATARAQWQQRLDLLTGATTQPAVDRANALAGVTDQPTIDLIGQYFDTATQQTADSISESLAATRQQMQASLLEASGDTSGATALRRSIELAGIDPTLRGLQQQIYAAEDAAAAQALVTAEAERAADASRIAAEEQARAAESVRQSWMQTAESIADSIRSLREQARDPSHNFAAAQTQFTLASAAAKAGDQAAAQQLPQLARAMVDIGRTVSATRIDQTLLTARTLASLDTTLRQIAANTGIQVPAFAVGTNYVPGDMLAQIHAGERIIPAADNRELMRRLTGTGNAIDIAPLLDEIKALREEVRAVVKNTSNTSTTLRRYDRGNAMATTTP